MDQREYELRLQTLRAKKRDLEYYIASDTAKLEEIKTELEQLETQTDRPSDTT